jgi:uncharacterized membrane protein
VLVLTAFTALAIFGTVQLTARVTGIDTASAANASATYSSDYEGSGSAGGSYGYSDSSQYGSNQNSSGELLQCPATGCTASYCHASR